MTSESHASPAATAGAVVAAPGQLLPPETPGWDNPAASPASATHQIDFSLIKVLKEDIK